MQLRPYQIELANKCFEVLSKYSIVYLAAEVRTGKTLTSLEVARLYNAKEVLFITKKKAIPSIESDYTKFGYIKHFNLTTINNESLHKVEGKFDLIISDEHHRNGAYPKPNQSTKLIKKRYSKLPMIFLSGTPHPESYSQVYHQFWVSDYSPFKEYTTFYKWAKEFVDVQEKRLGYAVVKDYSHANKDLVKSKVNHLIVSFTQKQAGFTTKVNEKILLIDIDNTIHELCSTLKRDRVIQGKQDVILADTSVKLQSKMHQLYSGKIKFESGNSKVLDYSKANYIKEYFKGKRIGIFYKFKAEFEAIKKVFDVTQDIEAFDNGEYNVIALQFLTGREGISLKSADALVYYNIDFSSVTYWQSRDRLTTMDRKENNVYWVFAKNGIEQKIYNVVLSKKDYTLNVFKRDFNI